MGIPAVGPGGHFLFVHLAISPLQHRAELGKIALDLVEVLRRNLLPLRFQGSPPVVSKTARIVPDSYRAPWLVMDVSSYPSYRPFDRCEALEIKRVKKMREARKIPADLTKRGNQTADEAKPPRKTTNPHIYLFCA